MLASDVATTTGSWASAFGFTKIPGWGFAPDLKREKAKKG